MQERAGRMVGSVNQEWQFMQARPPAFSVGFVPTKPTLVAGRHQSVGRLAVVRTIVTFRAHEGRARLQQWRDVRAVRGMAVRAVFGYRLVFPQERTTLFGMATEAGFVDGVFLEQLRAGEPCELWQSEQAILPAVERVGGDAMGLGALFLVAGEADFRLCLLVRTLSCSA